MKLATRLELVRNIEVISLLNKQRGSLTNTVVKAYETDISYVQLHNYNHKVTMKKRTSLPLCCRVSLTAIQAVLSHQDAQLSVLGPSSLETDIRFN